MMNLQRWLEAKRCGAVDPYFASKFHGGKGSAPAAPDYVGAAQEQGQASKDIVTQQTWANRPNVYTPFGNQTWSNNVAIDPSTGQPVTQWTSNVGLTPELQRSADAQQRIQQGRSNAAEQLLGQATNATATPMDWGALPSAFTFNAPTAANGQIADSGKVQTSLAGGNNYRDTAQEAVWQRMQPALQQRRSATETQLANQGLTRGSEAWNNAMRDLNESENSARLQAIEAGRSEAAQQFQQDLSAGSFANQAQQQDFAQNLQRLQTGNQAQSQTLANNLSFGNYQANLRQQAISEAMQKRGQPLSELNALLTGQQVNMPNMPSFSLSGKAETPNIMGAQQLGYQADMSRFNVDQAQQASTNTGLASAAMMAAMYAWSDRRLKSNVSAVGQRNGLTVYEYDIFGNRERGYMADEVADKYPDAVKTHDSGYLMVDYGQLGGRP